MLSEDRRVLVLDVPVLSPRELFRRAKAIEFDSADSSTPAPLPPPPAFHPGRTRAMERIGAAVLQSGRIWRVLGRREP